MLLSAVPRRNDRSLTPAKAGARTRRLTFCRGAAQHSPLQDCAQAVHATMPKQSAAVSAQEQRDRSILFDMARDELGKLDAPAIKRAMQFMEIEEVYPNKKSRMCALGGAAAGQPQQHRLSGVLTVVSCVRRVPHVCAQPRPGQGHPEQARVGRHPPRRA